jgi:hypothetical protein
MQVRGARPCFDVYVRASSSPILGIIEGILNLQLLNGIRSGDRDSGATERSDLGDVGRITVRIHAIERFEGVPPACNQFILMSDPTHR